MRIILYTEFRLNLVAEGRGREGFLYEGTEGVLKRDNRTSNDFLYGKRRNSE